MASCNRVNELAKSVQGETHRPVPSHALYTPGVDLPAEAPWNGTESRRNVGQRFSEAAEDRSCGPGIGRILPSFVLRLSSVISVKTRERTSTTISWPKRFPPPHSSSASQTPLPIDDKSCTRGVSRSHRHRIGPGRRCSLSYVSSLFSFRISH